MSNQETQYSLTLARMVSRIKSYQAELGYDVATMSQQERTDYRRSCMLGLYQEVAELVDSTPWKPWRSVESQTMDIPNAEREIVDCFFFLLNIASTLGITAHDLEERFYSVLENNFARIENGYSQTK